MSERTGTEFFREIELPASWSVAPLADICTIVRGASPRPKGDPRFFGGDIPWISIADVTAQAGKWLRRTKEGVTPAGAERSRYLQAGTLIVSNSGTVCVPKFLSMPGCIHDGFVALKDLSERVNPDFLYYYFDRVRDAVRQANRQGITQVNLNTGIFSRMLLPIPPRSEQDLIVSEIEKHFTRLDVATATVKRARTELVKYRAAIMRAAVEGRLVPTEHELAPATGVSFQSAHALLQGIVAPPRPNRWSTRSTDVIRGHAAMAVGNPHSPLPSGWAWSALVDIARMESGHTPSREHPEWWDGPIPWIGIADARRYDGRVISGTAQHTNDEGLANSAARLLPAGTVCISRTASVGYVVVMGSDMATSQDFVNWIPGEAVSSDWLRIVFSADREALRRFGKGSVH